MSLRTPFRRGRSTERDLDWYMKQGRRLGGGIYDLDTGPTYGRVQIIFIHPPEVALARHRLCEPRKQWSEEAIAELYRLAHPERYPNFYGGAPWPDFPRHV